MKPSANLEALLFQVVDLTFWFLDTVIQFSGRPRRGWQRRCERQRWRRVACRRRASFIRHQRRAGTAAGGARATRRGAQRGRARTPRRHLRVLPGGRARLL